MHFKLFTKKNKINLFLIIFLAIISLNGCQDSDQKNPRVLFVGNSLTFYNYGLDNTLKWLSNDKITTKTYYAGGQNLAYHWQRTGMHEMIKNGNWDYVVIQESAWTLFKEKDAKNSTKYVNKFADLISKSGAKTILYMTPTYSHKWYAKHKLNGSTNPQHFAEKIFKQNLNFYNKFKGRDDLIVAPCGTLFYDYLKQNSQHPNFESTMYDKDLSHPSFKTTYMFSLIMLMIIDKNLISDVPEIHDTFKVGDNSSELKRVMVDKNESKSIIEFVRKRM